MPALFKNNATATIASSLTTSDTTVVLSAGLGSLFPLPSGGSYFYGTLFDNLGNYEIIKCTARTTDTLTVVRGQDGTNPVTFAAGDGFALRLVASVLNNFVQLDNDQTITGVKTFTNPIVSDVTGDVTGNVTGNLTGNVTGDVTGNLTGDVTGNVSGTATALDTASFTVIETAGVLQIKYGATVVLSINSTGELISANNITAYGTPE